MAGETFTVIGTLVEDPELRFTSSGVALAKVRIAINRGWKDRDGEWQQETAYISGTAWRDDAENLGESSLGKGDRVFVHGYLKQNEWTADDGSKRSALDLHIIEIGASCKYAVVTAQRIKKEDGGGRGYEQSRSTGGRRPPPAPPRPRDDYGPDEAPF